MILNEVDNEADAVYRLTIGYDIHPEDPTQEGGVIWYMYDDHARFDRDVMWCHFCGEETDHPLHDLDSRHRAIMKIHDFVWHPQVAGFLINGSYWSLDSVPNWDYYDNMGTRDRRAVMMVNDREGLAHWNNMDENQREELLTAVHDEWKTWSEGECYWARVEKIVRDECGECHRKLDDVDYDSCGGFIGDVAVEEWAKEIVGDEPVFTKYAY